MSGPPSSLVDRRPVMICHSPSIIERGRVERCSASLPGTSSAAGSRSQLAAAPPSTPSRPMRIASGRSRSRCSSAPMRRRQRHAAAAALDLDSRPLRPGEATTTGDRSSKLSSRAPGDRDDPVAGLKPGRCGRAAWLDAGRRRCGVRGTPKVAKKAAKIGDREQEIGHRPGKHDQEALPHRLEMESARRGPPAADLGVAAAWLAGFMSPTNRT